MDVHPVNAEIAVKAFELSQNLSGKWLSADYACEASVFGNRLFEICPRRRNSIPTIRKPFDVLAEGHLVSSSRGDRI